MFFNFPCNKRKVSLPLFFSSFIPFCLLSCSLLSFHPTFLAPNTKEFTAGIPTHHAQEQLPAFTGSRQAETEMYKLFITSSPFRHLKEMIDRAFSAFNSFSPNECFVVTRTPYTIMPFCAHARKFCKRAQA
jgi:hypothetical protein